MKGKSEKKEASGLIVGKQPIGKGGGKHDCNI